ncbi:hypothetical protein [Luteimonas panaciterrae]|uniref:hypothetical protein n=1 Tax=Luteimonas panaciterrae TaxID=363885 RepID=UPI001CFBC0E9|nr:hypothetical protein [Luteimonas panaciterrae]
MPIDDLLADGQAFGTVVRNLVIETPRFLAGQYLLHGFAYSRIGMRLRGFLTFVGPAEPANRDPLFPLAMLRPGFSPVLWNDHPPSL